MIHYSWYDWLIEKGAPPSTIPDMEMFWLGSLGFTGALQDRWHKYFIDRGFTGTIDDGRTRWIASFSPSPPVDPRMITHGGVVVGFNGVELIHGD